MTYVIWNVDERKYVARAGAEHSFTSKLQDARPFKTREAAEQDACGNEQVRELSEELRG